MLINDPELFAAIVSLEGDRWAHQDRKGSSTSLTALVAAYHANAVSGYGLEFNSETAALFDHSGVVYGEGGVARYVLRGEEIVLDGSSTHTEKKRRATELGIRVI